MTGSEYNCEELFHIGKDRVRYKNENQISGLIYNRVAGNEGKLAIGKQVPLILFPALEKIDIIRHGFSTRLGGTSVEALSTMNLSFSRGDEEFCVRENFKAICGEIGLVSEDLVFSEQVHSSIVQVVRETDKGNGIISEQKWEAVDGMITNVNHLPLTTFYADCVPLYFVDTRNRAIGLSHSGWKGTVGKIGAKTVEAMQKEYGTKPEELIAVIGPSICRDCYEVSADVAEEFYKVFSLNDGNKILEKKENSKYQLDLWLANKLILQEAGVKEENISVSNICSCCNSSLLFSHRASKGKRGNLAAFLSLDYSD